MSAADAHAHAHSSWSAWLWSWIWWPTAPSHHHYHHHHHPGGVARPLGAGDDDEMVSCVGSSGRPSTDVVTGPRGGADDSDSSDADASASELRLSTAAVCIPHPEKVEWGGEDAHFISDAGGGALGIADGVGGWHETGVNPAAYSRGLMEVACSYVEGTLDGLPADLQQQARTETGTAVDPRGALHAAHMRTQVAGSSTACVLQLDRANRSVVAANLGDSGFVVVRRSRVVARSRPLQHFFDCPLQLGCFPHFVEATDSADAADVYHIRVRVGDVIVAGTDGLWDNAHDHEILAALGDGSDPAAAAARVAQLAHRHSQDPDFDSPYVREALAQGLDLTWWEKLWGLTWKDGRLAMRQLCGGKQDDVTVVVARVCAS